MTFLAADQLQRTPEKCKEMGGASRNYRELRRSWGIRPGPQSVIKSPPFEESVDNDNHALSMYQTLLATGDTAMSVRLPPSWSLQPISWKTQTIENGID